MSFYSGYAQEKPTSKVINPPGGRSSNIFGTDEPVKKENGSNGHSTNGSNNGNSTNGSSNGHSTNGNGHTEKVADFRHHSTSITSPQMNQQEQDQQQVTAKQIKAGHQADRSKSSVFEDQKEAYDQDRSKRHGYNTITGQSYSTIDADQEKTHQAHLVEQKAEQQPQKVIEQVADKKPQNQFMESSIGDTNGGKSLNVHTSSRVLQPPGGRSTNLW